MALEQHEQFLQTLERSKRPLIVLQEHPHIDDFTAAFGVAALLAKLQKPVEIVTSGGIAPKALNFLRQPSSIRGDLPNIRTLHLHLSTKTAKVDELSYSKEGDELVIRITPKTGAWTKEDVNIATDSYRYDLVVTIGVSDVSQLGDIATNYADFFFSTPIVNIDHKNENEHFGQLNIVDVKAVACSQVCHNLFKKIDDSLLDEEVATFFLTGMIAKTKSFRSETVTPQTLKAAGELIARGARRDEIVTHLYKTRPVETLRLWGRALARLKSDRKTGLVWTLLTKNDFVHAGADDDALEAVIDELLMSSPEASLAAVLYEDAQNTIRVMLHANRPHDALSLGAPFNAAGSRERAYLKVKEKEIVRAEKRVIGHLKQQIHEAKK